MPSLGKLFEFNLINIITIYCYLLGRLYKSMNSGDKPLGSNPGFAHLLAVWS